MRLLLTLSLLTLAGCPRPIELCGDGEDNDGDGLIDAADSDCASTPQPENCANGADDDGDGIVDCEDADCVLSADCLREDCEDGFDNDTDGFVDCDDTDCSEEANCLGALVWALSGDAIVNESRTAYAGKMFMTDTILDNDAGRYDIDEVVCSAEYQQLSDSSALPAPCPDCDWALSIAPSTHLSHVGPECETWYDFTDTSNPNYRGVWNFPEALGYTAAYQGDQVSFPAVMFFVNDGDQYNGWYAWAFSDDMSWDPNTGRVTWRVPIGYFSYQ
ncbi:MAG: hypothetical protein KC912_01895 [Proteobacteria bacterium]|nr:hypothetical protein [Pseudomonadota bacterium]